MKCVFQIIAALIVSSAIKAQSPRYIHPSLIEIHYSLSNQANALNHKPKTMNSGIGISFIKGINNHLDWKFTLNGAYVDSINKTSTQQPGKALLVTFDAALRARLFHNERRLHPYAQLGIGISQHKHRYQTYMPAGIGLQAKVWRDVYTIINSQYRLAIGSTGDHHFFHSIGIAGTIVQKKSQPRANKPITIPATTAIVRDSDQDGIPDNQDLCPNSPGLARYNGCPVPDADKDGINDEEDKCIHVPGPKQNAGCPTIAKDLQQAVDLSAKQIYFLTASAQLLPESFNALNQVAAILIRNPHLNLQIHGHTDNVGTAPFNQDLSERRAKAVLNFLQQQGVSQQRLTAKGFGQQQPIASNNTTEGRSQNRRVELHLYQ